jgi:hypothetical protein
MTGFYTDSHEFNIIYIIYDMAYVRCWVDYINGLRHTYCKIIRKSTELAQNLTNDQGHSEYPNAREEGSGGRESYRRNLSEVSMT